jgi:hypothetical protein
MEFAIACARLGDSQHFFAFFPMVFSGVVDVSTETIFGTFIDSPLLWIFAYK